MSDPSNANGFVLLNDQPVRQPDDQDALGMTEAVSALVNLILESRESAPFTLGIDAGWGMGKSSIMLQLQEALYVHPGVITSWFNAWTAEEGDALEGLIKSALMSVDENMLRRALRRVARNRNFVASLRIMLILVASFFHLARTVDQLWNVLSVDTSGRNAVRGDLHEIFSNWAAKTKRTPAGRLLVVFIDDLDRCSSEVVLAVCEAMKLYLAVPGVIFVVGCDQDILAEAALRGGRVSQAAASLSYLEKIVQITYRKPAPDEAQMRLLVDYYADLSGTRALFADSAKQIVIGGTGRNPRRIKRLINSFILEYRLDQGWADFGAEALINVILLQHFYPDFYRELARPTGQDLAHEFLEYYELRNKLQLGHRPKGPEAKFFEDHGTRPPSPDEGNAASLSRLEEELPVYFPRLARRREFVEVLTALCDHRGFGRLMSRLQSRVEIDSLTVTGSTGVTRPTLDDARDHLPHRSDHSDDDGIKPIYKSETINIVWISPDQGSTPAGVGDALRTYLESQRANVYAATDLAGANQYLKDVEQDVIILSINNMQQESKATNILATLRLNKGVLIPAIFFTSRVTPARMQRIAAVDAELTSDPIELAAFLDRIAFNKAHRRIKDPHLLNHGVAT